MPHRCCPGISLPPPLPLAANDALEPPPPSALQLSSVFRQYDISTSSSLDIDVSTIAFSAGASSYDSVLHECVHRKLHHSAKRLADKTKILHQSSRLSAK
ncbi:hypothetical protein ZWY2020_033546 [Hordeum vulgare]|nr:hypothetical protein ZWY2020_033546 [Hordeum vulgare]